MSLVSDSVTQLNSDSARTLPKGSEIVVVDRADGNVVDRFTLIRFAGDYRPKPGASFAVKDSVKFRVKSAGALGLTPDSPYQAFLASEFDTIDLTEG